MIQSKKRTEEKICPIEQATQLQPGTIIYQAPAANGELLTLQTLDIGKHLPLLHRWFNHKKSLRFWQMEGTFEWLEDQYKMASEDGKIKSFIGTYKGIYCFLTEIYFASDDEISNHFQLDEYDYGFHFFMAPAEVVVKNLSFECMKFIMAFLFSYPKVHNVFAEPDIENTKVQLLLKHTGFSFLKRISLTNKQAAFCRLTLKDALKNNSISS